MVEKALKDHLKEKIQNGTFKVINDFKDYLKLVKNFAETDPDVQDFIREKNKIYQVKISDIDFNFWVEIKELKVLYGFDIHPSPEVTVLITEEVFTDFLLDKIDPAISYMAGHLNIIGSVSEALFLGKLLIYNLRLILE